MFMPQQKAQIELSAINDTLIKGAAAETAADLPLLAFPLRRSLATLEALAADFDDKLRPRLLERIEEFRGFADGPDSILAARADELDIMAKAEGLLDENVALSRQVGDALDRLVGVVGQDIGAANQEAVAAQRFGSSVLIGMVLLSLLSSGLIVWLYVDRNLIARLTALSNSMLAIAGGNLRAPLPAAGPDEIGRMAEALSVFRDTAIEIEENNLRKIGQARQRLIDAIESISEGFRLLRCRGPAAALQYPLQGAAVRRRRRRYRAGDRVRDRRPARGRARPDPGSAGGSRGLHPRSSGPTPRSGSAHVQRRADGRWILIGERRVAGGGTVAVYADITELKQRELELEEANRRTSEAAAEIGRKHQELETLSTKLAKYLSPQVYDSIFSGKQEVKIASQRKKMTVLFSDLAGFTETTEKLESEELTHLLNEYLTEMSRVALHYGATIDKYVGDAIMIFFGDPESRGVREDALACVKMAIAMQKRMLELAGIWHDAGIERPLRCRIGISTGYCTVGNFGSEDRMDYTIIGAGVNLASRLENAAPAGGILISYETYAHVKHEVHCEERGEMEVRGIATPVAVYEAIDLHANLRAAAPRSAADGSRIKLELDLAAISDDDRGAARELLQRALQQLSLPPSSPELIGGPPANKPRRAAG